MQAYWNLTTETLLRLRDDLGERLRDAEDVLPEMREEWLQLDAVIRYRAERDARVRERVKE